jgi:phenylpropionate dioxygenase-like ring-hydroxylating dioxygenase large terminal subunit
MNEAQIWDNKSRLTGDVFGASQVGVFDFVPRIGFKEYWYPGIEAKLVRDKPRALTMLGEDIIFFSDQNKKVVAVSDYCPHRGARFSGGTRLTPGGGPEPGRHNNEFRGFLTCPYHGFTFDGGSGECVAALTEGPDSKLVSKLRVRAYPTVEVRGIVFVWMGKTTPVPIEEDIPEYFFDDDVMVETYVRRWDLNWSLTIENSHDSHAVKIHRGSLRRLWNRSLFRKSAGYHGKMRISKEEPSYIYIGASEEARAPQQAFYPGVNHKWPQHVWFQLRSNTRRRKSPPPQFDPKRPGYTALYQLPAWVSPSGTGKHCHLRMCVPINEDVTRMWTFTCTRKSFFRGPIQQLIWKLYYNIVHIYQVPQGTNEMEDMPVQSVGCLDPNRPQKLGASDGGLIYWRRRMPMRSRDALLVWKRDTEQLMREIEQTEDQEAVEMPV